MGEALLLVMVFVVGVTTLEVATDCLDPALDGAASVRGEAEGEFDGDGRERLGEGDGDPIDFRLAFFVAAAVDSLGALLLCGYMSPVAGEPFALVPFSAVELVTSEVDGDLRIDVSTFGGFDFFLGDPAPSFTGEPGPSWVVALLSLVFGFLDDSLAKTASVSSAAGEAVFSFARLTFTPAEADRWSAGCGTLGPS